MPEEVGAGDAGQMGPRGSADPTHEGRDGLPPVRDFYPRRRHRPGRPMGPRGSADPTHEGRDGLPPVRDFSPPRRHRPSRQMGPRGSADPTHEGRDGLPPVRDFSPRRRHRPGRQMGPRGSADPTPRVGAGCRPSVTSPRLDGIGSTPKRAAVTGASGPRPVGSSTSRRLDRKPCPTRRGQLGRTDHDSAPHPPTGPPLPITPGASARLASATALAHGLRDAIAVPGTSRR